MNQDILVVKKYISEGKPASAINFLKEIIADMEVLDQLIMLESRLVLLEKNRLIDIINLTDYNFELNKINNSLLNICNLSNVLSQYKPPNSAESIMYNFSNLSEIKSFINRKNDLLFNAINVSNMEKNIEKTVLINFAFPDQISFDFGVFCVHTRASQVADKVLFIKLNEFNCPFNFNFIDQYLKSSQYILSKSSFRNWGQPSEDGISEILENREDYRLNSQVLCFDRKIEIVMGRRDLTPKAILFEMKKFNSENKEIEVLTFDGFFEYLGICLSQ